MAKKTKYWFKRKRYGYGWVPVTWQGWLVIISAIGSIVLNTSEISEFSSSTEIVTEFVIPVVCVVILLLYICYKKGPSPRWNWGKNDDPDTF